MESSERLKKARLERGFTQQQMADALGVARNYIYLVESGRSPMSKKLEASLAQLDSKNLEKEEPRKVDAGFAEELEAIKRRLESIERLLIQLLAK